MARMSLQHVFMRRSAPSATRATTNQGRGWTNLFTVIYCPVIRANSRLISYLRDFINLIIYHEQIVRYRGQFFFSKSGTLWRNNCDIQRNNNYALRLNILYNLL